MFKILTVGLLFLTTTTAFAMDDLHLAMDISMKSIVRTKLWYEGVTVPQTANLGQNSRTKLPEGASEELIVAIEKFEQI